MTTEDKNLEIINITMGDDQSLVHNTGQVFKS